MTRITAAAFKASQPKAPRRDVEGPIHRKCLKRLRERLPCAVIHHSPNETPWQGLKAMKVVTKAKANGTITGFPDLLVIWLGSVWAFEVKAPKGTVSKEQTAVGKAIQDNGGEWAVVRSVADLDACLDAWIGAKPRTVNVPIRGGIS